MSTVLSAFDTQQLDVVQAGLEELAQLLVHVPGGGKVEEDYWAKVYRRAKGYDEPDNWSNLPFRDFIEDGVGVEWKLLKRKSPAGDQGRRLMHPAATRTISFDPAQPAQTCADQILTQWGQSIEDFRTRVRQTSVNGTADIRWGVLLWSVSLDEFLYFEEELVVPDPREFEGRWIVGNHRGKETRNLHIFERDTGIKRYSVTLPKNGAKLQPYFDVPTVAQGAHLFRVAPKETTPLVIDSDLMRQLEERAASLGISTEELLRSLLGDS